jgi:hypothetical protein
MPPHSLASPPDFVGATAGLIVTAAALAANPTEGPSLAELVGRYRRLARSAPNIAATPHGSQVWFTLKDTGKTEVFDAKPPFTVLAALDTGPITKSRQYRSQREWPVRLCHGRRPQPSKFGKRGSK